MKENFVIKEAAVDDSEKIGEVNANFLNKPSPKLRKQNKIKTIHSSLKIEGNTLTEEQITALLENKRVIAPESIENYSPHVKRHFMDILEKKEYSVVAELGNADLGETKGKLKVGQLLPLLGKENLATIRINGTPALQGYTGESDGNYSIKVTRGIEDKKPSAIQEKMVFKQVTWPSQ